jgi:uncharacterized protein
MPEFTLTLPAARLVVTHTQGLARQPEAPARKEDLLSMIQALGLLQIDTINIVARSPYLALFSRLGAYKPDWLDELLVERQIFEYWSHAACYLPAEDYPLHRRLCIEGQHGWMSPAWYEANRAVVDGVLDHIRANGPARSADFERSDGKKGSWWDWKVEKRALEYWFARGELMTTRRHNFQRVYDLRERVRPDWDDRAAPPLEDVERELALKAVRALGVAKAGWVGDYFRRSRRATPALVRRLAEEGLLLEVEIAGWDEPLYAHPALRPLLAAAEAGSLQADRTTLLTPFDLIVCDRSRAREFFDFDFSIECYLPAPKRKYGYFLLPILHRGALVGRLDAKAHRKEKLFEVKALFLEPSVQPDEELAAALAGALRECAEWHGASAAIVRRCEPEGFLPLLQSAITKP